MKTNRIIPAISLLLALGDTAQAQTQYDAERFIGSDLNGTARFVGMGGAMSALGGDISTMQSNPAGIGLFRRNDVALTFGVHNTETESQWEDLTDKGSRTALSFDQVGMVFSNKISNQGTLRYVNFGVNYHKQRNFSKSQTLYGNLYGFSLTDQIAWMANHDVDGSYYPLPLEDYEQIYNELDGNYYGDQWYDVSWLSVLGIQGGLIGPSTDEYGDYCYVGRPGSGAIYKSTQRGGVNVFDFNISANLSDRVYLGMTVGFYDVNYERTSAYKEDRRFDNGRTTSFTLNNVYKTEGSGVDAKFGIIARPFEESAFRLGLAIHTPTYYKLSDRHSASLSSYYTPSYTTLPRDYSGITEIAMMDYELLTPWKFNFSMGHTLGSSVAIGAEYEYADYSSAELSYDDGVEMAEENNWISEDLKGVHTVRVGVEAKLVPEFSVRAGYNYSSAAFDKSAYKWLYPNSTRTDAEYENMLARNTFTVGIGYRADGFYLDAAYQYNRQKSEFYPFDSQYSWDAGENHPFTADGLLPATEIKTDRSSFLLTLGYKF